jgi:hypothetical protein
MGKFPQQLGQHCVANTSSSMICVNSEIKDVQPIFVQFVDHESDNLIVFLSHHAYAITLPQTSNEVIFVPCKLKT